ncbi:MAG: bifunctional alpha/beta hydrolase/OsmC family protein [Burkholderiaceae bacterium]|nr:bifunctional alpha/beta hydrolase/OsmC family protein [Burkholderiaceae bacterium]
MGSVMMQFAGGRGAELSARLDLPDGVPRAFALFAHCFTCSKDTKAASYVARAMAEAGFGVLRFDFTGLGGSGGDFASTNFSSNVDDLVAAADWLRAHHGAPAVLVGHSLGGAAVIAAAHRISDARAVVTIGAPCDPGHVRKQFERDLALIEREGEAQVSIAGRAFTISRAFLDDLDGQQQVQRIRALGRALLVMHSPVDGVVAVDNARRVFEAAMHPKSFVSLDGADHMLSRVEDARFAAGVIAAWAGRYVEPAAAGSDQVPAGLVRVAERGTGKFANAVSTARHTILADEPVTVGGTDLGLSPYELLQAALGACTTMTLRMYADMKKLPVRRISVDLRHDKVHAEDCVDCESATAKIDRIERVLRIDGELDESQRERLLAIADRCPVHRTLHGSVEVLTRLESSASRGDT